MSVAEGAAKVVDGATAIAEEVSKFLSTGFSWSFVEGAFIETSDVGPIVSLQLHLFMFGVNSRDMHMIYMSSMQSRLKSAPRHNLLLKISIIFCTLNLVAPCCTSTSSVDISQQYMSVQWLSRSLDMYR